MCWDIKINHNIHVRNIQSPASYISSDQKRTVLGLELV